MWLRGPETPAPRPRSGCGLWKPALHGQQAALGPSGSSEDLGLKARWDTRANEVLDNWEVQAHCYSAVYGCWTGSYCSVRLPEAGLPGAVGTLASGHCTPAPPLPRQNQHPLREHGLLTGFVQQEVEEVRLGLQLLMLQEPWGCGWGPWDHQPWRSCADYSHRSDSMSIQKTCPG